MAVLSRRYEGQNIHSSQKIWVEEYDEYTIRRNIEGLLKQYMLSIVPDTQYEIAREILNTMKQSKCVSEDEISLMQEIVTGWEMSMGLARKFKIFIQTHSIQLSNLTDLYTVSKEFSSIGVCVWEEVSKVYPDIVGEDYIDMEITSDDKSAGKDICVFQGQVYEVQLILVFVEKDIVYEILCARLFDESSSRVYVLEKKF